MGVDVSLFLEEPGEVPQVALSAGDQIITVPWPVWELLVHRASHKYVSWALAHPQEYGRLERVMYAAGGLELVQRRSAVLSG